MVGRAAAGAPVKQRPSPVTWLEARGVRLTPVGRDRFRCACPVHGGNPGTMGISLVDGVWLASCFSCHFGGDAISLVMAVLSCTFKAALIELKCRVEDLESRVELHKRPCTVIVCDVPGCVSWLASEDKTYKIPGTHGPTWTMPADEAVMYKADLAGWWIGAVGSHRDGQYAICEAHT